MAQSLVAFYLSYYNNKDNKYQKRDIYGVVITDG
jgi:hypothetical protein